jgi:hypothetical protein
MPPNHESVNEALAIAHEGYNEAARPIEAMRFERIAELLTETQEQLDMALDARTWNRD